MILTAYNPTVQNFDPVVALGVMGVIMGLILGIVVISRKSEIVNWFRERLPKREGERVITHYPGKGGKYHPPKPKTRKEKKEYIPQPKMNVRGEMIKKHGLSYDKPSAETEYESDTFEEIKESDPYKGERIVSKWKDYIDRLIEKGELEIDQHQHHGSLRGADIARQMQNDLKRIGMGVDVEYKDSETIVRY